MNAMGLFNKWMSAGMKRPPTLEEVNDPALMIAALLTKMEEATKTAPKAAPAPDDRSEDLELPSLLVPNMYVYVRLSDELNLRLWGGILSPDGLYGDDPEGEVWVRVKVEEVESRPTGTLVRVSYGSQIAAAMISGELISMVRPIESYRELQGWSRRDDVDTLVNASGRAQRRSSDGKAETKRLKIDRWPNLPSQGQDLELVCFAAAVVQVFKAYDARHSMEGRGDPVSQFLELMAEQYKPKEGAGRHDPKQKSFEAGILLQLERTRQTGGTVGEFICRILQPLRAYPTAAEFEATLGAHTQGPDEAFQAYYSRLGMLLATFPVAVRVGQDPRYVERALKGLREISGRDVAVKERARLKFRDMIRDGKTIRWRNFLDIMEKTCEEIPKGLDKLTYPAGPASKASRPAAAHRLALPPSPPSALEYDPYEDEIDAVFQLRLTDDREQDF
jgi:hypothetical protein